MINDKTTNIMNPARKAFESELRQMLVDASSGKALLLKDCADRLLERARRVINKEDPADGGNKRDRKDKLNQ